MEIRPSNKIAYHARANRLFRLLILAIMIVLVVAGCASATETETVAPASPTLVIQPSATQLPADTATAEPAMELASCASVATVSLIQTPVPVTPTATGSAPSASPTPRPATPTPRAAPSEDRVGFPTDYQEDFKLMYVYDRLDNRQVRVICGNEVAGSVKQGEPFP